MESFLQSGDRNIEQFMEEYQEKRKLAHLRRIKVSRDLCDFTLIHLDLRLRRWESCYVSRD